MCNPSTPTCSRVCRWLTSTPAADIANGGAPCFITVPRSLGRGRGFVPHTSYYLVQRVTDHDGCPVGWRFVKEEQDRKGVKRYTTRYFVDTTFGPAAEHHTCDCDDFRKQAAGPERACKHTLACAKLLAKAGVEK